MTAHFSRRLSRHPLALGLLLALSGTVWAAPDARERPADESTHTAKKRLGTVTVKGLQPTSLPTQIPTTMEGIRSDEIDRKINAIDSPDALKYFPSLLVRKRYIGDFDHAVLATRASGTGNSARSLIYADGILLSNLLGNGASFTPRWGLVTPEEIERVDVLYGPFSAAYPGNSVGAVVDYVTRMPQQFEAHAKFGYYTEKHELYATNDWFPSWQASASVGSRSGDFSWWVNLNRLDSAGHPIAFASRLLSAGASGTGTAVTGAVPGNNPRNQPWLLLGATNQIDTVQDHAKIKAAYDFTPTLRLSYVFGWWDNDAVRNSESLPARRQRQPGVQRQRADQMAAAMHSPRPISRCSGRRIEHQIHGLSLKSDSGGNFDYNLSASRYDYATDLTRSPDCGATAGRYRWRWSHRRWRRNRLDHVQRQRHVALGRHRRRAHRRLWRAARRLPAGNARLQHQRLAAWWARVALLGVRGRHPADQFLRAGHLAFRAGLGGHLGSALRALARRQWRAVQRQPNAAFRRA